MSNLGDTDLSTTYQKKTQKEHIKDAPDTYVGAVEPDQIRNWSFDGENLTLHPYTWTPALYKIFDEAISFAIKAIESRINLWDGVYKKIRDLD